LTTLGPRVVIAGTHSGVGKTTVATGIMAALAAAGRRVGAAKVGPDFIDPGYHALATGRPSRNLDAWICGESAVGPLAARGSAGRDLLVIEGVMGLFDGAGDGAGHGGERDPAAAAPRADFASTAHVARLLDAPVVLVVDAAAMSGSVAALVHGFCSFDPSVRVAGVILNRVASPGHEALLRDALAGGPAPVVGALRRDPDLTWRDRHLGLVPVVEHRAEVAAGIDRLAAVVARDCDLAAIDALARSAPATPVTEPAVRPPSPGPRVPVALAAGPAFSFTYPDNVEALEAAGAELVPFDPLTDPSLPERCRGLVAGGGFPEVFADHLGANRALLDDVRRRIADGLVTWAECGGLLWLSRSLDGTPMAAALPCDARMTDRLTLGYRQATTRSPSPLGPAGTRLRGHEFHYSTVEPGGGALSLTGRFGSGDGGFATGALLASYLHLHLGAAPELAERFVATCRRPAGGGN